MVGCPKECIEGGVADIITESVDVPEWESGDFVTNEMWVSNHTGPGWVESGQIAGDGVPVGSPGVMRVLGCFGC